MVEQHPCYREFSNDEVVLDELTDEEFMSMSAGVNVNTLLRNATNLHEVERIFRCFSRFGDDADSEDMMILDERMDDNTYNSQFMCDWKSGIPMTCFLDDSIPVIALAFSSHFYKGAVGTYKHAAAGGTRLSLADVVKLRASSYHGDMSCDRYVQDFLIVLFI